MSNKRNWKAASRMKAQINKAKISKQVDQAKKHDGQNFSLLATGKEIGIDLEEVLALFAQFMTEAVNEDNGWVGTKTAEITTFIKGDKVYYLRPVGHADPNEEIGFKYWDFHINKTIKEDFLNYIKTKANG